MFRSVEVADPLRTKQLRAGLTQLGEEGAIQVFRPVAGSVLLLGAVGQLQFEVVAHRLEHEYGVKARILPSRFQVARWVTCEPDGRRRQGAAALHRRQPASRRLRRGRCADRAGRVRARAARDREQLAEDPLPRAARARGAGVPEAARGLTCAEVGGGRHLAAGFADGGGRCRAPPSGDARLSACCFLSWPWPWPGLSCLSWPWPCLPWLSCLSCLSCLSQPRWRPRFQPGCSCS